MVVCARLGIIIEVINYVRVSVEGQRDVELKEKRRDGRWRGCFAGQGEEDVSSCIGVIEDILRG